MNKLNLRLKFSRYLLFWAVLSGAPGLWAQGTSSIQGVVTDPTKAVVADAKITMTEEGTGVARSTTTQATGQYQFSLVRPGTYTLVVEAAGFAVSRSEHIKLLVDTPVTLDLMLQVAQNAATVDVTADATQINTVDASIGNAFEERQVQSLPIQTRNAVQLLSLQPGVTQDGEVMGARRDQNNITLDGVNVNDNQNALSGLNGNNTGAVTTNPSGSPTTTTASANSGFNSALPVPLDSVEEFRVTVAGDGAAAGHSSGGQVALVTRSGTNTLHGSAYEYNRNTDYTANNWFNNLAGLPRPQLVRNQFGATLGGPIKKDRIFYFFNYERRLDSSQQTQTRMVPSATLREGIVQFQTKGGNTYSLSPAQVQQADPLHLGASPAMLQFLQQFPTGNAPALGGDKGLNFDGYLFNAPVTLDYRTYVGRMDWVVDSAGKHTLSFRGTLSNQDQTNLAAQFPGQAPASELLADNRGFGVRYTALVSPTLTNTFNVGLTRIGYTMTGNTNTSLSFGAPFLSSLQNFSRGNSRINPTWNITDDVNWVKGNHTVTIGGDLLLFNNTINNYANSFQSYSFSRGLLYGLGADINQSVLNTVGAPNGALANGPAVASAMGSLLGILTNGTVTYNYLQNGSTIPIGSPTVFDFLERAYEFYLQDSWKVTPKLTVTYGLHYQYETPPWEANGLQVAANPGLNGYFGARVYAASQGIPANQLPNGDLLSYTLNGPGNGQSSWYHPDPKDFAPRLAVAYAATNKTVFRMGLGMVYDQYGPDLAANIASGGSIGLSSQQSFPVSYNFTTAPRYTGGSLPGLPAAPQGGFPFTPPLNHAISGTTYGISPDIVSPYAMLANVSVSHQFNSGLTLDAGYVGRFARRLLAQEDVSSPLLYFTDPQSGTNFVQATNSLEQLYNAGLTANQVKANPSLVPITPFVQNMFPALANHYFPGSASANYFYGIYGVYSGSVLDNLHSLDRVTSAAFPNCIVATGCYTFFAPQSSADPAWFNAAASDYNALTVTLRRSYQSGFSFDFNYSWSHSIDNMSSPANGISFNAATFQNSFAPYLSRASSDFDLRHQFNANFVYDLPVGKGKMLLTNAPGWLDEVIGGWSVYGLVHVQSGLPSTITGDGAYNSNYYAQSLAVPLSGAPGTGAVGSDQYGYPSLFASTAQTSSYTDALAGGAGMRAIVRMPWLRNVDTAVTKSFKLPWEGHTLQFRAEAFNLFNFVNFTNVSLSLSNPGTFGEFQAASDPRVLQLALRYSF